MTKKIKIIFTFSITIFFSVLHASQFEWELKKDSENVKVYTREVAGNANKDMMVVSIDDVPFEVVAEVVKDYNNYQNWYGMCKSFNFVNKNSANNINMYYVLEMPILKNRDAVLNLKYDFNYEKGIIRVDIKGSESNYKKNSGLVRMPKIEGSIVITRESPDKTKVVYTIFADLSAKVPAAIINMMAVKHPYDTAVGLRNEANKKIYKESADKFHSKDFKF